LSKRKAPGAIPEGLTGSGLSPGDYGSPPPAAAAAHLTSASMVPDFSPVLYLQIKRFLPQSVTKLYFNISSKMVLGMQNRPPSVLEGRWYRNFGKSICWAAR